MARIINFFGHMPGKCVNQDRASGFFLSLFCSRSTSSISWFTLSGIWNSLESYSGPSLKRRKESKRAQFSFLLNLCARSLLFSFLSFQSGSWSGLTTHCFLLRERQHQLGHQALDRSLSKESKSWPGQSSRGIFSFFHTAYKRKRKRSNMWSHMRFLSFF